MTSSWSAATRRSLTLDDKLALLAGRDLWHTVALDGVGVPVLKVTDGPRGARGADGNHGPTSTNFPCGSALGASWDPDLIGEIGVALAQETKRKGAHVLLGPTVNIPRVPNAGRNFECFSEDPLLSGLLAAAWIDGVQSQNVGACLKHFVCNDQETDRYDVDVLVDERTLREIYLEPFRIAVEAARPWSVMSAYNTVNGRTASEHPMLEDVLRSEFGFDGLVMSDWYGTYSRGVIGSGLDLEMPGPARWMRPEDVGAALEAGEVTVADVDRSVDRLLHLIERTGAASSPDLSEVADEQPEDRELARRAAVEGMVLLTNDGTLPLRSAKRIAVIGEPATDTPHQGGGSSSVNPHRVVSVLDGVSHAFDAEVTWMPGCDVRKTPPAIDPACLADGGLTVEYFDGPDIEGEPVRRVASERSWLSLFGTGDDWVNFDRVAVRMSGTFVARRAGRHTFHVGALGRVRARVGEVDIVDAWDEPPSTAASSEIDLEAGQELRLEVEFASVAGETWRYLAVGCREPGPEVSIESAARVAAAADVAIVVVGLGDQWESEGFDRPDLRLPGAQDRLVSAVAAAQPRTVVVIAAGAPIEMPWIDDVSAVVMAWYGGQEVGYAVADVLLGTSDPSGRLPVTFPADSRQHPGLLNHPGDGGTVRYGEGVYVGYRGFDRLGLTPLFAFGHGMSYTTFDAGVVQTEPVDDAVVVQVRVANVGERSGTEVLQVYAHGVGDVDRRLVGFQKVRLEPGASATTEIRLPLARFRFWRGEPGDWSAPTGEVTISVHGTFGILTTSVEL